MTKKKDLEWQLDSDRPVGKGAGSTHFKSSKNGDELEIETKSWGEGDLRVNGELIAHVEGDETAYKAFRELEDAAEDYEHSRELSENKVKDNPST